MPVGPKISRSEARRKIKDVYLAGKEEAKVPAPVDKREALRKRILAVSLFPNTHNKEFLLSDY